MGKGDPTSPSPSVTVLPHLPSQAWVELKQSSSTSLTFTNDNEGTESQNGSLHSSSSLQNSGNFGSSGSGIQKWLSASPSLKASISFFIEKIPNVKEVFKMEVSSFNPYYTTLYYYVSKCK